MDYKPKKIIDLDAERDKRDPTETGRRGIKTSRRSLSNKPKYWQDVELAQRCITETEAQAEFFQRYSPNVYQLMRRIVGNDTDAEDLLQDSNSDRYRKAHRTVLILNHRH